PDAFAVGDNPAAIMIVDQRPQVAQAPPQGGAGIIRHAPEHGAESVAPVRTRSDRQIGKQRSRFFGWRQLYSGVTAHDRKMPQDADVQQLLALHGSLFLSGDREVVTLMAGRRLKTL